MTSLLRNASQKNAILIAIGFLCLFLAGLIFSKAFTNVRLEDTPENQVKMQINALLTPVLGVENFKVEVTQKRKDLSLEQQTIAVIVDDKRQLSPSELDQINTIIRAAVGYDVARGDMIRVMTMPFQKPQGFLFNKDVMLLIIEAIVLLALLLLFVYYLRLKPQEEVTPAAPLFNPPQKTRTLSEQVVEEPAKAAAVLRVWLNARNIEGQS